MIFSKFKLTEGNYFVAMEYYGLILNRTFLILLTKQGLVGAVANGIVSAKDYIDPLTALLTYKLAIHGELNNHLSYLNDKHLKSIENLDFYSEEFLEANRFNFRLYYDDISEVSYNSRKKLGMGSYPHDGNVYIKTHRGKREFIILGNQSGQKISSWIKNKIPRMSK